MFQVKFAQQTETPCITDIHSGVEMGTMWSVVSGRMEWESNIHYDFIHCGGGKKK